MKNRQIVHKVAGGLLLLLLLSFFLLSFFLLSKPVQKEIFFLDYAHSGWNWSYTVMREKTVEPLTPEFEQDYSLILPKDTRAVKITRTLLEPMQSAELGFVPMDPGIAFEVFLNGEKLYSEFGDGIRNEEGFLISPIPSGKCARTVRLMLPKDYVGSELTVMTYFPPDCQFMSPAYPYLCNDITDFSIPAATTVTPVAQMTFCAIFAMLLGAIYVLNPHSEKKEPRTLLLLLFFLLLFLDRADSTLAGANSILSQYLSISVFSGLYIAPLLLYLALYLPNKSKYLMSAGAGVWFIWELIRSIRAKMAGYFISSTNFWPFFLLLAMFAVFLLYAPAFVKKEGKNRVLFYAGVTLTAAVVRLFVGAAEFDGNVAEYLMQFPFLIASGLFTSTVSYLSEVCAVTASSIIAVRFFDRVLQERETVRILEERNRMAMESYQRMIQADKATLAARHEMRHHMLALFGMLKDKETQRALSYIDTVQKDLALLPRGRYSSNSLVDIITGSYLERAAAEGIQTEASLPLPPLLPLPDQDLCVFLTNMLENAYNACKKAAPAPNRYIRLHMYLKGSFLFFSCENSAVPDTGVPPENRRLHGYGMENMRRIAQKYSSVLDVEKTDRSFKVMTCFSLPHT